MSQREWGPILEEETRRLIQNIIRTPSSYKEHINWQVAASPSSDISAADDRERYLAMFMNRFTYGTPITEERLKLAEELSVQTQKSLRPGYWIVDSVPLLAYLPEWLPGMGFKKWCRDARAHFDAFTVVPFRGALDSVRKGEVQEGMIPRGLQELLADKPTADMDVLHSAACSTHTAATETTSALLFSFILLMTLHQDVQSRAYKEISDVVGTARLPLLSDLSSLPYINAILKEVHRYHPAVSIVSRSPSEHDEYGGYFVPKGAWVIFNLWAITHDDTIYNDPDAFNPDRHLNLPEGVAYLDPRDVTFGLGKRICPGINLANAQIALFMAQVLSAFHITMPSTDDNGAQNMPHLAYTPTFVSAPEPFTCCFSPRDDDFSQQLLFASQL
ncbi:cytochrome P450 [Fomitopsis serialis]|uniref:cytochrome P450 n=1 Tax=Fomitopsis serialis TaxID=139415 RepID=UPI002007AB3D|nr:cytochrome P450 [Neoantrodia serialis]KAH9918270.1 cytochrome P450 [Neoantrodia serialis]